MFENFLLVSNIWYQNKEAYRTEFQTAVGISTNYMTLLSGSKEENDLKKNTNPQTVY